MAGNRRVLDTVIVAAYFNKEPVIRQKLANVIGYVSSITIGELYFGAYNSQQTAQNVANIRNFIALNTLLGCDEVTADYYGQIKRQLRVKGRPIPENDIWIAATALQYNLPLVSRDAHFQAVNGLLLEVW
ncbi:MAG: type II toxin-antitoxin system VapC family toxin [Anaerolineae bacterium]|nr:type II toxin-antitoxin system VapC family toxin [Anaerolineae bacterium]